MPVKETKIRTAGDIWMLVKIVGGVLCAICASSLLLVKESMAAIIILALPVIYIVFSIVLIRLSGAAMMMNVIGASGVKNIHRGEPVCSMQWDEIGDFGVAEATKGIFSGKYIYLSRVFVRPDIRQNVIKKYDPRICIVLPCNDRVCAALKEASKGKIDIR